MTSPHAACYSQHGNKGTVYYFPVLDTLSRQALVRVESTADPELARMPDHDLRTFF